MKPREYPFLPQLPAKMYLSSAWYAVLDAEAKALLLDLLLNYWVSVRLPADNETLAAICRTTTDIVEKTLPKLNQIFQVKDGWLQCDYLDNKRKIVDKHRNASAAGGRRSSQRKPNDNGGQQQEQQGLPKAPTKEPSKDTYKQTINHEPLTNGQAQQEEPPKGSSPARAVLHTLRSDAYDFTNPTTTSDIVLQLGSGNDVEERSGRARLAEAAPGLDQGQLDSIVIAVKASEGIINEPYRQFLARLAEESQAPRDAITM